MGITMELILSTKEKLRKVSFLVRPFNYSFFLFRFLECICSSLGTFWGAIADDIAAVDPPSGFQGLISWLFLPAIAAGMYFDAPVTSTPFAFFHKFSLLSIMS